MQNGAQTTMEALLVMFKPDGERKDFHVHPEKRYIIGRKESCQLRIPLPSVSREHAAVYFDEEEDELMIEDLGSSNGTFVNSEKIDEPHELVPGDVVLIGNVPFQVVIDGHPATVEPIKMSDKAAKEVGLDGSAASLETEPSAAKTTGSEPAGSKDDDDSSNIDSFFGFDLDDEDI